ncbi:MAG: DUF2232 domain-containing protein [Prochlorotrichaceae cyanobacterium]
MKVSPPDLNPDEWDSWIDEDTPESAAPLAPDPTSVDPRHPSSPLVVVETAFLASTAALLWLVNYYFPVGPLLRICFPIPIALAYLRSGARAAWMTALVATLLLTVLMGPTRSLLFIMPFGILGVLLGVCWHRKQRWEGSICLGTLLSTIGLFFRIWLTSVLLGEDLWIYVTVQVREFLAWGFLKLGLLIQPELWAIQLCALGLILLNSLIYLITVHLLAYLLLDRVGNPIPAPPAWIQVLVDT